MHRSCEAIVSAAYRSQVMFTLLSLLVNLLWRRIKLGRSLALPNRKIVGRNQFKHPRQNHEVGPTVTIECDFKNESLVGSLDGDYCRASTGVGRAGVWFIKLK